MHIYKYKALLKNGVTLRSNKVESLTIYPEDVVYVKKRVFFFFWKKINY
jgi:hypothetical protein